MTCSAYLHKCPHCSAVGSSLTWHLAPPWLSLRTLPWSLILFWSLGLAILFSHAVPVPEPLGQTGVVTVTNLPLVSGTHIHTHTLLQPHAPHRQSQFFFSFSHSLCQSHTNGVHTHGHAFLDLGPHSHFLSHKQLFSIRLPGPQSLRQPCMKFHTPSISQTQSPAYL